jgi:Tfp pilus assembly protein PilP
MTLKSYLLLSGGTLLAGYLVTSQPGVPPERVASPRGTAPRREASIDIQEQATRLQTRVRQEVEYKEPSRNPFRFASRQPSRQTAPVDPAPPPVIAVPEPPPIRLSGVATEGNSRSAFLQTVQGVIEVREGDTVPPDYRVSRITEDAVELVTGDGTTRRIVLRP